MSLEIFPLSSFILILPPCISFSLFFPSPDVNIIAFFSISLMSSQFPSSCLMAVPNSQVFLSDKDLNDMARLNVLLTSSPPKDPLQATDADPRGKRRRRPSPPLNIRIPTSYDDRDDDEGLKTPTSAIHRISEMLQCPPAPRKPKSLPSKKRRASRQLILLDLSKEIDSLFPRPIVFDHVGGQIKKFKK